MTSILPEDFGANTGQVAPVAVEDETLGNVQGLPSPTVELTQIRPSVGIDDFFGNGQAKPGPPSSRCRVRVAALLAAFKHTGSQRAQLLGRQQLLNLALVRLSKDP